MSACVIIMRHTVDLTADTVPSSSTNLVTSGFTARVMTGYFVVVCYTVRRAIRPIIICIALYVVIQCHGGRMASPAKSNRSPFDRIHPRGWYHVQFVYTEAINDISSGKVIIVHHVNGKAEHTLYAQYEVICISCGCLRKWFLPALFWNWTKDYTYCNKLSK